MDTNAVSATDQPGVPSCSGDDANILADDHFLSICPDLAVRDDKYFFADGDCMFLADGILFKLHKLFLSRDPESMFRGMFSMPQGKLMDLDLITLSGDSADEFRALCWAVYALPDEILVQSTPKADIPKLLKVAKMCDKYTLPIFETWALNMILNQCELMEGPSFLNVCTEDLLLDLMTLGLLSNHGRLLDLVESTWLSRLRTGELPYASALAAGERHGRTRFLADLYYHLNKELCTSNLVPTANPFSHLRLTDKQLLRLLSGCTLLSNFWNHLREDRLHAKNGCTMSHSNCTVVWTERIPWTSWNSSDVLQNLGSAQDYLARNFPLYADRCPGQHLKQVLRDFNVVDYFFGPQDS
ncbi:hypothetical protein B0H19DRAFT_422176 [Mycena capillaripes]|nr:hypothetical protein B0H19DRAFT_422176 [Mycena capillaripes]